MIVVLHGYIQATQNISSKLGHIRGLGEQWHKTLHRTFSLFEQNHDLFSKDFTEVIFTLD